LVSQKNLVDFHEALTSLFRRVATVGWSGPQAASAMTSGRLRDGVSSVVDEPRREAVMYLNLGLVHLGEQDRYSLNPVYFRGALAE
jgi:hypothetical protein